MIWGGAQGETADQMKKVLRLSGSTADVMNASGKLAADLQRADRPVKLRIANRLFGQSGYAFETPFLDATKKAYGAPLEPTDFARSPDASRTSINDWVAVQTEKRIQNLIPEGAITGKTRLILTNAIYVLGDWATPFEKEATHSAPFHKTASDTVNVPTMNGQMSAGFAQTEGVKLLRLPYKGDQMSMLLVLPEAPDGLADVEAKLSNERLDGWVKSLATDRVSVALPRFEIDPPRALALGETLASLGMAAAFDSARANFHRIAKPDNTRDNLFISHVFHKAFVKVDEKGTEAAAASAVVMDGEGAAAPPSKEFRADRPFLFFIRDEASGLVLFMGRVADPSVK